MEILLEPLLQFFDDPGKGDNRHASALIGFIGEELNAAAFAHYLAEAGMHDVQILAGTPTPGTRGGKWLDRWIYVKNRASGQETLYQCEIKNWAASAIGGHKLAPYASAGETLAVAQAYWDDQLRRSFGAKKHPTGVTKVFMPMKIPEQYEALAVEPLLVYWMPVAEAHAGTTTPFFTTAVAGLGMPETFERLPFERLSVFSVSLYLRSVLAQGIKSLTLPLPASDRRMQLLSQILA